MTQMLKELTVPQKLVLHKLALGYKLAEICRAYELNLGTWEEVVGAELFKAELRRERDRIVEEELSKEEDPIRARLRSLAMPAMDLIASELSNHDFESDRATASTRLNAATSVLDRLGYSKSEEHPQNLIVINFSQEKLQFIKTREQKEAEVLNDGSSNTSKS